MKSQKKNPVKIDDLDLVWDKDEQSFSEKHNRFPVNNNTKRNLEEYFEFLSEFECDSIQLIEDRRVDKQFKL